MNHNGDRDTMIPRTANGWVRQTSCDAIAKRVTKFSTGFQNKNKLLGEKESEKFDSVAYLFYICPHFY